MKNKFLHNKRIFVYIIGYELIFLNIFNAKSKNLSVTNYSRKIYRRLLLGVKASHYTLRCIA